MYMAFQILIFFFFLQYWGLNSGPMPLRHSQSFFVMDILQIGSCRTISPGWLQSTILLISASWEAKITDMSHRHPAQIFYLHCWSQHGYFSGIYCVSRIHLEFPTLGGSNLLQAQKCHRPPARLCKVSCDCDHRL
jgi:hypothetical protein